MKNFYDDKGEDLFKPLIDRNLVDKDIIKKLQENLVKNEKNQLTILNKKKIFSKIPPTYSESMKNLKDINVYMDKRKKDNYDNLSPDEKDDYKKHNPGPSLLNYLDRPPLSKALGRFTINALSKIDNPDFYGVTLDTNLISKHNKNSPARGLFTDISNQQNPLLGSGKSVVLNPSYKYQDILSTLVHEGNHAIEHYNPYINKTVQDFLNNKIEKEKSDLTENYLPNLYKGIQDIINLPDEFTIPYKLNKYQETIINKDNLYPKTLDGKPLQTSLAEKFEEIPAFALETLMRDPSFWKIDENKNDDSRKLLRRIMKQQQQQYRNLGLVDINQPEELQEGSARYKYNKARVPIYAPSTDRPNYNLVDNAFIDKIEKLRKPLEKRKRFNQTTTTSTTPNQTFQNPITQSPYTSTTPSTFNNQNPITQFMNQNQSSYQGNQLTQLMQQPDSTKRSREGYDSEIDNTINKRSRLNTMTTTTTPSVNRIFTSITPNRRYSI